DVANHKVVATIRIDGQQPKPKGVVVHPNGRWVYVANGGAHNVAVIDGDRNEVTGYIPDGTRPCGIGITSYGQRLSTAHGASYDDPVIDRESRQVIASIRMGTRPGGLVVGR